MFSCLFKPYCIGHIRLQAIALERALNGGWCRQAILRENRFLPKCLNHMLIPQISRKRKGEFLLTLFLVVSTSTLLSTWREVSAIRLTVSKLFGSFVICLFFFLFFYGENWILMNLLNAKFSTRFILCQW